MMDELVITDQYNAFKTSSIQMLEQLPIGWKVKKVKHISKILSGDSLAPSLKDKFSKDIPDSRPYISSKDVNAGTSEINYENGIRVPFNENTFKIAPKDSSIICIEGGSAGKKIGFVETDVCYVNKLACLKSKTVDNKYLFYSLFSEQFQTQFKLSLAGLIGGVSISAIKNFWLAIPPFDEQLKISSFLDEKVAIIHEAISAKEKQIELIKERLHLVIQRAVTKGLNPKVSKKDSGIEWVGEIPEHWNVIRFKNLFSQSRLAVRESDGVVTSYRDGEVTLRANRRLEGYTEAILEGGYQGVRQGQLVLNSMDAFEGAIGVSDSDGKCTPEYVVCDPRSQDISQYYYAYLLREMALARYIQVICNAVRQRAVRIRFNNLAGLFMINPPKEEQDSIVNYIQRESQELNKAIWHLKQQIEKLKEYKTTLINSAVTGKIKVA